MAIQAVRSEQSTYDLIKEGLKASVVRAEAISNNMANINTENYKRFNVVFEENLRGTSGEKVNLKTSNNKHLGNNGIQGNITVEKDLTTSMRTDGNNVDLDVEKVNQAANTLKYNALIQRASGKRANLRYVISGR